MLTAIPYTTFPTIEIGPLSLRTFGVVVAIGVLLGAWLAARYGEEHGIPRDTTYSLAMRMVVVGRDRLAHHLGGHPLDELESPVDAIAIWQGGLQFSGGFVFAVIAGYPVYRHWNRLTRWHSLDGYAYGLTIGLGIGRIGCYAVGEHFGSLTSFPLAVRYDGGPVREDFLGTVPLDDGDGVPPDRALRADVHGGAVRDPHRRPVRAEAAARPRHRHGDLLRLLRRGALRLRLAAGERRDACSGSPAPSTSAWRCSRPAPGSGSGSASSSPGTSPTACRSGIEPPESGRSRSRTSDA